MERKPYYDVILDDVTTFDKMVAHLESLKQNAPNGRTKALAETVNQHLDLVLKVLAEIKRVTEK